MSMQNLRSLFQSRKLKYAQKAISSPEFIRCIEKYNKNSSWETRDSFISYLGDLDTNGFDSNGRHWRIETIGSISLEPYIATLEMDGVPTKGIIIPEVHSESENSLDPWNPKNERFRLRTIRYFNRRAIEMIVRPNGKIIIPFGKEKGQPKVREFEKLSDFISYLEEEMAKGNYPRHLTSDWR